MNALRRFAAATAASFILLSGTAWAQDEDDDLDDFLDDFLNEESDDADDAGDDTPAGDDLDLTGRDFDDSGEMSVGDEVRAVREGDLDDRTGVKSEDIVLPEEQKGPRRLIKTLQKKNFLKLGRYEAQPFLGFVTNDPFINRYLLGANFAYHPTEIFAVEASAVFSPDFGKADWKPITHQLVEENRVSPDISKILFYGSLNFQFSPIYGKLAVVGDRIINFDIYGAFGSGVAHTEDDLEALQCSDADPRCNATASENQVTMNFGGGFRVIFTDALALKLEARSMIYIETVNSTTLEYKNNLMIQSGVSFFFPQVE